MRRTRFPAKPFQVIDLAIARKRVRLRKRKAERDQAKADRIPQHALALAFVPDEEVGRFYLTEAQEMLVEWLSNQPDDAPLHYHDVKRFAEILLRLAINNHNALQLVRVDLEDIDDGGGTRLAQVG